MTDEKAASIGNVMLMGDIVLVNMVQQGFSPFLIQQTRLMHLECIAHVLEPSPEARMNYRTLKELMAGQNVQVDATPQT